MFLIVRPACSLHATSTPLIQFSADCGMKPSWFLLLSFLIFVNGFEATRSRHFAYCKALRNITRFLAGTHRAISVTNFFGDSAFLESTVLKAISEEGVPSNLTSYDAERNLYEQQVSGVAMFESAAMFLKLNERVMPTYHFAKPLQMFVLFDNKESSKQIEYSQDALFNLHVYYFLVEEDGFIRLMTFVWFTPKKCRKKQLIEINRFDMSSMEWKSDTFKIEKFNNFHGCTIRICIPVMQPWYMIKEIDRKAKTIKCQGTLCRAIDEISHILNFKYKSNSVTAWNKTVIFKHMLADFSITWMYLDAAIVVPSYTFNRDSPVTVTQHSCMTQITFEESFLGIPAGEEYDGYEKLLLPFDAPTWFWIAFTFGVVFTTIFIVKLNKTANDFVVGKFVATPSLNVVRNFFGVSQARVPGRNFARYLLMMIILFSLIIRTAYQAKMFEFLQKEMRKPTVTSIEEMIDQNFTFYMNRFYKRLHRKTDFVQRATIVDDWNELEILKANERLYDAGSKTAVRTTKTMLHYLKLIFYRDSVPKLLKNPFSSTYLCMMVPVNNKLYQLFGRKLQQFRDAGLIDYISRYEVDHTRPKQYTAESGPKALTLEELEAGFVVCMTPLAISFFVFCLEWMTALKDLIVFHLIFKKLFEMRFSAQQAASRRWIDLLQSEIRKKSSELPEECQSLEETLI